MEKENGNYWNEKRMETTIMGVGFRRKGNMERPIIGDMGPL